ncbi:dnaJ-like protein 60 [Aricia agestis]|uniref:dnaJ-like protein 60 n=1 Tax=Aricia agestis TaxID=91739 RepID=UPI001C205F2F|nr:dnaJ-like protein 60 [Aricia agestis]
MFALKRSLHKKSLCTFFRYSSFGRKTHYETLNLQKDCSDKDIKDAFIKLSKQYHPDKNKDAKAQEKFVKILEAYNVLGKPGSRAEYDNTSYVSYGGNEYVYRSNNYNNYQSYNQTANQQYNFYNEPRRQSQVDPDAYYGFKGIKKVPNFAIIALALGIAVIGVILQYVVIKKSYFLHQKHLQEKQQKISEEYNRVRASAHGKTNEMQTQMMLDKLIAAAAEEKRG